MSHERDRELEDELSGQVSDTETDFRESLEERDRSEPKWPICKFCRVTVVPTLLCRAPRCPFDLPR